MKRFNSTERAALVLAAVLFIGGLAFFILPQSGTVIHEASNPYTGNARVVDRLTAPKSRMLGVMAITLGAGLAAITIYGGKR